MGNLGQDLRYALRGLFKAPAATFVLVLTIGLGIAATAVIFSLVDALVLRPLAVEDQGRLVWVQELIEPQTGGAQSTRRIFSQPGFAGLREGAAGAGIELAAFGVGEVAFRGEGDAESLLALFTSANYFDLLGVKPARGRFFDPTEDERGATEPVAVISDHLWRVRLGGDPAVIGRTVYLNSQPVTVVGVAPPQFGGTIVGVAHDIWIPTAHYNRLIPGVDIYVPGRMSWLEVFSRLGPGAEAARVEAQLGAAASALPAERPNSPAVVGVRLERFTGIPVDAQNPVTGFMVMLQLAAGLVLLIASINVGGVLLARAAVRRHEVAVRLAVGAGRGRLLRQLLTESILLFVLGGGAGLLLAAWGTRLLTIFEPPLPVRISLELGVDPKVIAVSLLLALLTGLGFGLAPALEALRPGAAAALKGGASSAQGGGERRRTRLRNAFVTAQLALSLLLLCTAGLFTRALQRSLAADAGFDPDGVVVATFDTGPHGYDSARTGQFYQSLLERVRGLPGVERAALAALLPSPGSYSLMGVEVPGQSAPDGESWFSVEWNVVDVGYFETLRIARLAGRVFNTTDRDGAPAVAVVNEAFVRRFWPGEGAIGKVVGIRHDGTELEVVGVVRDAQDQASGEELRPQLYRAFAQSPSKNMTLVARLAGAGAGEALTGIRNVAREIDPNLPLHRPGSLAGQYRLTLLPQRLAASAIGAFGLVGLLLAGLGIYGVLSFQVGQRTREIGVRLALGARTGDVVGLVLRQGLGMIALGLIVGLGLALAGARLIAGFLHGVDPGDLLTFTGVPLVLLAVALLASWIPARRAARVDPMVALRAE